MCIDYRSVNAKTIMDCYPLPHDKYLISFIPGSCWFTKLNLSAGYHQIRIATAITQETSFNPKFDLYKSQVLSCILENTRCQFLCMMSLILEPVKRKCIVVFLEDIMIHPCTLADHVIDGSEVITLLTEHGLKAKRAKCSLACLNVDFCGFNIDHNSIHTQEQQTRAVIDWPQPYNSKVVRGFLSLTRYYTTFIEHYAMVPNCLR
jgi:hypothetical protein